LIVLVFEILCSTSLRCEMALFQGLL